MLAAMPATPSQILARFIADGLLDPLSRIETLNPSEVAIVYLRVTHPHAGIGRRFLRRLNQAGWHVHIRYPTTEALPFWRRMNAEHLVDDDPDEVRSWNDFIGALGSQMKKPDLTDGPPEG